MTASKFPPLSFVFDGFTPSYAPYARKNLLQKKSSLQPPPAFARDMPCITLFAVCVSPTQHLPKVSEQAYEWRRKEVAALLFIVLFYVSEGVNTWLPHVFTRWCAKPPSMAVATVFRTV